MANSIKPTNFPYSGLPLTGDEELYSQTNGLNTKFKVEDVWDGNLPTIIYSGDTIFNYDTINIYSGTTVINNNSGTTIYLTDVNLITGATADLTDNGDGTYTFDNNIDLPIIIKPVDYSYTEIKTGEKWIDSKDIYRRVVQLPQWTLGNEGAIGNYILGLGKTFENIVRLDAFANISGGGIVSGRINLGVGDGSSWTGALYLVYDGTKSYVFWENFFVPSDIILYKPIVYFILEYTKP